MIEDQAATTIIHLAGPCVQFGSLQRQRCAWCGILIVDDDLSLMAVALNPDGSTPTLPSGFPPGKFIEIMATSTHPHDGFRALHVLEDVILPPDPECEQHTEASIQVPDNACMWLPAELTVSSYT